MSVTIALLLLGQVEGDFYPEAAIPLRNYLRPAIKIAAPESTTIRRTAGSVQVPPEPSDAPPVIPAPPAEVDEHFTPIPAPHVTAVPLLPAPAPMPYEAVPDMPWCSEPTGQPCSGPMVAGGITPGSGCPTCPSVDEDDDESLCTLGSTCDMPPHYPYQPAYHGYYYFRPYNYTAVAAHQEAAVQMGLDPRMPYSVANFQRIYAKCPMQFSPTQAPIGTALPQGNGLPELESLLEAKPESTTRREFDYRGRF
jgi:hypothetical protein